AAARDAAPPRNGSLPAVGCPSTRAQEQPVRVLRTGCGRRGMDADAVVIGAGPNGLVAAATLARHGWRVLVLEAKGRPGGAVYSGAVTLPGYPADRVAPLPPLAASPAPRHLALVGPGLRWGSARYESSHPAPDGSCVSIATDPDLAATTFGPDGAAWRRLADWRRRLGDRLAAALLAPLPALGP